MTEREPATRSVEAAAVSVVVVTGLSGAGKSTALHALEDLGFFCIDNLPTVLAPNAVAVCEEGGITRIALGMDVRVRAFLGSMGRVLGELAGNAGSAPRSVQVLFLDASDESLLRRFGETRRPHPLSGDHDAARAGALAVLDGVQLERERLAPLRARADVVIDTTARDIRRAGELVEMTATEFDVLVCLVEARGRALSRDDIFRKVWGPGHHGTPRTIDNFLQQLRAKLEIDPQAPRHFHTVRGVGYRFDA